MGTIVGVDLHHRVTQLAVLGQGDTVQQYRVGNEPQAMAGFLERLPVGTKLAVEATRAWWWFVEQARAAGHEVVLSHPKQTKAVAAARLKTDRVDAAMLARLLKADLLPTVWIPDERARSVRELLAHRARLGRVRTGVINELHALYAKRNVSLQGKVWLRAKLRPPHLAELSGYAPRLVAENVEVLGVLNRQLEGIDDELKQLAAANPEAQHLLSIPGVGPVTAVAVWCWVGDVRRFATAKHLASYFGLAPRGRKSAERTRYGHISKEGNRLVRWLLVQAALSSVRLAKGPGRRHYLSIVKRRGRPIARIATARKLVGVMFHLLKEGIDYNEFVRLGATRSEPVRFDGP